MQRGESLKRRHRLSKDSIVKHSGISVLLLLWGMIFFALHNPALTAQVVTDALRLCIGRVIPILFPIAAAGGLLTAYAAVPAFLGRWVGRLFRISTPSVGVLLISLVAGFPIGAMLASRLWERGRIDEEEASRLACYTNNASGAFLTGCVGVGYFGNPQVGWILWIASSAAALTVGLWMGARAFGAANARVSPPRELVAVSPADSIKSTAVGMLNLTAFVSFFAVFCRFLNESLTALLPDGYGAQTLRAAVVAFFEITGGLSEIASLPIHLLIRVGLAGLFIGWSGVSVILQCMAAGKAVQGKRLWQARLWTGLLSGLYAILFGAICVIS